MTNGVFRATFDNEDELLAAALAVRQQGLPVIDAYTPHAVHGLDRALGLRPSRLTWVCFVCGMLGALGMLWFQHWTASIDWRLDVGGKPWNSLPADVPVAFEAAVLFAGFGSVFALLFVSRLFPGRKAQVVNSRVTDDLFVLVVGRGDSTCDLQGFRQLVREFQTVEITEEFEPMGT